MPAKAACSSCGKTVQRGRTSRPEITCQDCRRIEPKPYGSRTPAAPPRQCEAPGCEVMYVPGPRSKGAPLQRFCSRSCVGLAQRVAAGARSRQPRTCEICGKPYERSYALQRTCGRTCGVELRRREETFKPRTRLLASRVYIRPCEHCGELFVGRREASRFCSRQCYGTAYNNHRRPARPAPQWRCACGTQIPAGRKKCDDCVHQAKRRRKAYERGARVGEPYWFADIAARDRYRCGICVAEGRWRQARVAMTETVPHPKAPTIDHIVPLSEGGEDTAANVRLAHFRCNSARGNRGGGEQLAMIG